MTRSLAASGFARAAAVAAVALLAVGVACEQPAPLWAPNLGPPVRDSLSRWLLCTECTGGERVAASAVGARGVSALADVLDGLPEAWLRAAQERNARAASRIGRHGADSVAFVTEQVAAFAIAVQVRAAIVLGDIPDAASAAALQGALNDAVALGLDEAVVRAARESLARLQEPPFDGTLSDSAPPFLGRVTVRPGPSVLWDGDESVVLQGAPFADALLTRRWGADSLEFIAAGEVGRYALSVVNLGPAQARQRTSLRVRAFPAPPMPAPRDLLVSALPETVYQSLARVTIPPDTAHYFRLQSATDLPVTATVEWHSPAVVRLEWRDCAEHSHRAAARTIAGTVMNHLGVPLGGARISLLGTQIEVLASATGTFTVPNVPLGWQGTMRVQRLGFQATDRPAREGHAGYWLILRPVGPVSAPGPPETATGPSPITSTGVVRGGVCRLLGVIKTDTSRAVIARLIVRTP